MKKALFFMMAAIFTFLPSLLLAEDSLITADEEIEVGYIVVTATRNEQEVEDVTSSVTVITGREIERKQPVSAVDVLRGIEGIHVVQSGGLGKSAGVIIRGGEAGHTLVMIDGMQVNSPTLGMFNFGDLMSDNIERIEIIRGPQSTLYGSDALTGVINIITKKGSGPAKLVVSVEGGSYETYKESAALSGGRENASYSLSVSRVDSKGFSTASEKNGNREKDGYGNTTLSGRTVINVTKKLNFDLALRYTDADTDLDSFGGDDPNYKQELISRLGSIKLNHQALNWYSYYIKYSATDDTLKYRDPDTAWNNSEIKTRVEEIDWQNDFYTGDINVLTLGYEYEKEEGQNNVAGFDNAIYNNALYLQEQLFIFNDRLTITAGARKDDHSMFDDQVTYRAGISFKVPLIETRLMANWGEGFKAPTLNDLFYQDPYGSRGNPDLKPEESTGYDIGFEQWLGEKTVRISTSYFFNDFENLIDWVEYAPWAYEPRNISSAETKGWEFGFDVKPHKSLLLSASCTILDTEDKATGNKLARRPENKGSFSINWTPGIADFNLSVEKVGKRWDDSDNTEKLKSYTKVDLATSFDVSKNLTIFGRGENLLNEDYEESSGYGTAGLSYYGGIKAKF